MSNPRCSPERPVAILSFHSHSDRSFLDDRDLALLSGVLRQDDIENDLVVVGVPPEMEAGGGSEVERRLLEVLERYDPIAYGRLWDPALVQRLRRALPDRVFIELRGEHVLLETIPADIYCDGDPASALAPLIRWLRGQAEAPPLETLFRRESSPTDAPEWVRRAGAAASAPRATRYAPNLRPVLVNPERLPAVRTFSILGNEGCPFQLDARENPLYAGVRIPEGYGRGCAFCTTGNHYEGRPNAETAASVLEQIRYVRRHAPELNLLVLKDQNPFGYLTEVIESCAAERLSGFTVLLETRAEWFLRNARRFDRALEVARGIGAAIAPFLVGIENFSQPELDRFNKGTTAAANIDFIETLWRWKDEYGDALDLGHTAFGFILFSPWTTMEDLEVNLSAIRRTHFDRLRGSLLLSRARLYPDTALYYLAECDGLLAEAFESGAANASRRYGYYPSRPWRFLHPDVAHFAALATELAERNGSRDMVNVFDALLAEFRAAGAAWPDIAADAVWRRFHGAAADAGDRRAAPALAPAGAALRARFARLIEPLSVEGTFASGWRFGPIRARPGCVAVELQHSREAPLTVEIVPRGPAPHFQRSRHYDIRAAAREFTAAQSAALAALSRAIVANDR